MSAVDRKEYALAIKKWCDLHPKASDERFLEMIDRVESKVRRDIRENPISIRSLPQLI
jgi:hypothetical protein